MKYAFVAVLSAFLFSQFAAADICGELERYAQAIETNTPDGISDTPVLGAGETECSANIGLEPHGLGGHRMGVSSADCYWDSSAGKTYLADDVRDMAYHLHSCPVLIFDVLEDYDEGIEYSFTYGDRTLILLGNDEGGMYLNIFLND